MSQYLLPAEWEKHSATWIAWPHLEKDWPGKLEAINWVYTEIVRALVPSEPVEIICHNKDVEDLAINSLKQTGVLDGFRTHIIPNDRSWLRDSMPTAVKDSSGALNWINWKFNAWAKYDNHLLDDEIPKAVSKITGIPLVDALREDNSTPFVLEGGVFDTDGEGTLLVTEECLLSSVQERNPGLDKAAYEAIFKKYLGINKTIWLNKGILGDDTHGHIDDICRFVAPGKIVLCYEEDKTDANFEALDQNYRILKASTDVQGNQLELIKLPMPKPLYFDGERLPASYANFYIANKVVLVPTFNDASDRLALEILSDCFPGHEVIGIHAVDLVLGYGTFHCLTQQQVATGSK